LRCLHIVNHLTNENVLEFLVLAETYNDEQFKRAILLFVKWESRHILKKDSFREFRNNYPKLGFNIHDLFID